MQTRQSTFRERHDIGFRWESMTPVHWLAAVLAATTGTIHLSLYANEAFPPFLFAGVVFFAAIGALLFNVFRRAVYALGVPFTAGQIALWAMMGMPNFTLGLVDKAIQVALIVLLVYLFVAEHRLVPKATAETMEPESAVAE